MGSRVNNPTRLQSFGDSALCQLSWSLLSKIIPFAKTFFHKEACKTASGTYAWWVAFGFSLSRWELGLIAAFFSFMINRTVFGELD